MRILAIVIKDYRQYRNLRLEFPKPQKDGYDLNVLVGKNGFGKTNLANALCWCLWEREPDLALKEKNTGKPIYNLVSMEEVKSKKKSGLEVSVSIQIDLENKRYEQLLVNRTVVCSSRGFIDMPRLSVVKTSKMEKSVSFSGEDAQDEINRHYPSDLSDYLIFDGERLTTYFQNGQAAKIRQSAINLSSLNKLDTALSHHQTMSGELTTQMSDASSEIAEALAQKDAAVQAWKQNEEDLQRHEDEVAKEKIVIGELKEAIGGHEHVPELIRQRDELKKKLEFVEGELVKNQRQKCAFVRKYYPLLTVMAYVPEVRAYVMAKRNKNQFPPPIKKEVFEKILKAGTCSVCGEVLSEKAREHILAEIDKYNQTVVSTETYHALTDLIEPRAIAFTERLKEYLETRDYILDAEAKLLKSESEISDMLHGLEEKLSLVNDAEGFRQKVSELQRREAALSRSRDLLGVCRANRDRLTAEKNTAIQAFDRVSLKGVKDEALKKKYAVLQQSTRIIGLVYNQMLAEVRKGIETKANEYWRGLMWKPADQIGKIEFSSLFDLKLMDGDQPLIGTLSAAERSMLALSTTWAIHSQAGMNFPFFIDTPVSNMSSDSRRDFAMELKKIAKDKQVVLLFTDTEYVADIPDVFEPVLNTHRVLSQEHGVTTIA